MSIEGIDAAVAQFVGQVEPADRRDDCETLVAVMSQVTGDTAALWGSIVGFGRYHYRYASGREGDSFLIGFSARKSEFSLYLSGLDLDSRSEGQAELLARLGKHRTGRACLYIRRLADVDLAALKELLELSTRTVRAAFPKE